MKISPEQAEVMIHDMKPFVDGLIETYGERLALIALFGYLAKRILDVLGPDVFARTIEANILLLKAYVNRGQK